MKRIKNYHTHTLFCGHGKGHPIDYAKYANLKDFEVLGFSEHAPTIIKGLGGVPFEKIDQYYNEVHELKKIYPNMKILCGLEVDYFETFHPYFKKLLERYDFLSLSCHYIKCNVHNPGDYSCFCLQNSQDVVTYTDILIKGMESGFFSFVNHPDLFIREPLAGYEEATKKIVAAAIKYDLPLELNLNQMRARKQLYERDNYRYNFWKYVGKTNAQVIINFDAHFPEFLASDIYLDALSFAKELNLNLVDEIKIVK